MKKLFFLSLFFCFFAFSESKSTFSRIQAIKKEIEGIKASISSVKKELQIKESLTYQLNAQAIFLVLIVAFASALWAIYTDRSPLLWFFVGFAFSLISMVFILLKSIEDKKGIKS